MASTRTRRRKSLNPRRVEVNWSNVPTDSNDMSMYDDILEPDSLTCQECGKNFVSHKNLDSHKKTHTNSKPYQCKECGNEFSLRNTLICHFRVHTKERPYTCTLCFKSFTQASTLKAHVIYKHTKQFPYKCDICGRGFISPGQKLHHRLKQMCSHRSRRS